MEINKQKSKLKVNLLEQQEVTKAALAAKPRSVQELDATLSGIRATGHLLGKCYADETEWVRPRLMDALGLGYGSTLRLA